MEKEILHKGKIVSITPETTVVEIIAESACSACHAKSLCSVSESEKKLIELPTRGWDNYAPGDEVELSLKASLGHKAVWLSYAVPLVILMAALLVCGALKVGELVSGLYAILAVALYYFVLWLFRDRLRKEYIFNIKR